MILTDLMMPYFWRLTECYLEFEAQGLLGGLVVEPRHQQGLLRVRLHLVIREGVPLCDLVPNPGLVPVLALVVDPVDFLLLGLPLLPLDEVLVGDVEHGVDIFAGGGYGVEGATAGLGGGGEEGDGVGFEEFEDVGGHFGLHLVELLVLGGSVHLEGTGLLVPVLRLAGQRAREPVRVRVHVVVMLHLKEIIQQHNHNPQTNKHVGETCKRR